MSLTVKIWDLPTRLFHWALVLGVAYSWYSVEIMEDMEQHFLSGYFVLTLLLFRLIWGFVGSRYARFSSFLFSVSAIKAYARGVFAKNTPPHAGHNPMGSLSVIAMLLVLLIQATTGLFSNDDYSFGPLSGLVEKATRSWATEIHHINSDIIWVLVAIHILAIGFYQFYKKERLVGAMITGKKQLEAHASRAQDGIKSPRLVLALIIFLVCAAFVYWLANAYIDLLPAGNFEF